MFELVQLFTNILVKAVDWRSISHTVSPGGTKLLSKKTREGEDGWLAALNGAEEQSADRIEANAAKHQVFPDVRVLPLVFLLWQSDLGAAAPITCCSRNTVSLSHSTMPPAQALCMHFQ